jgi:hypothetical protein
MPKTLMGGETEYAISALRSDGEPADQSLLLRQFMAHALATTLPLTTVASQARFVGNGGLLYLDSGLHLEWSTPEVRSPRDLVRYLQAGDKIVHRLAGDFLGASPDIASLFCTRCNVDYLAKTQWASHESFLHHCRPSDLPSQMLPFLASRVVLSGAGGWDCRCAGLRFTMSPRAQVITETTGMDTQHARPLFHVKNETLSRTGSHRLHVCCSETLCSDIGVLLRFGSTALVLALIEAGGKPGHDVTLLSPVAALRRFAVDPNCKTTVPIRDGRQITAIDIQRHYLGQVQQLLAGAGPARLPEWAEEICLLWTRILDDLEAGPAKVEATLDWAIKHRVFSHRLRQHGISWSSLADWNRLIRRLQRIWISELRVPEAFDLNQGPASEWAMTERIRRRVQPLLDESQLDWNSLPMFVKARGELFEIDMRFGSLATDGIFCALDASGVLKHRVPGLDLAGAVDTPPCGTRAKIRGDVIRRFSTNGTKHLANWTHVVDLDTNRVLDLGDPFETEERWAPAPETDSLVDLLDRLQF